MCAKVWNKKVELSEDAWSLSHRCVSKNMKDNLSVQVGKIVRESRFVPCGHTCKDFEKLHEVCHEMWLDAA